MNQLANSINVEIEGEDLTLLPQKAILWKAQKSLLIADLHLGKGNHFRKNGIAIPAAAQQSNWTILDELLQIDSIERVLFLGDLFHSSFNDDCLILEQFIQKYPHIAFELIKGNHDILEEGIYERIGLKVHHKPMDIGPFTLSHEPLENETKGYNLAGHIHPALKLKGKGRQTHKAACFHFGKKSGLLPAFGSLTGLHTIPLKKGDQAFLLIEESVIPAQ